MGCLRGVHRGMRWGIAKGIDGRSARDMSPRGSARVRGVGWVACLRVLNSSMRDRFCDVMEHYGLTIP